jgi:hypothetical protein
MQPTHVSKLKCVFLFIILISSNAAGLFGQATGGTVSISGSRRIHRFTATGSLAYSRTTDTIKNVKFTVVGGGGQGGGSNTTSGGNDGAGGGGGGVYDVATPPVTNWVGSSFVVNQLGTGGNSVTTSSAGSPGTFSEITWNGGTYFATGGGGGGIGGTGVAAGSAGSYGNRSTTSATIPTSAGAGVSTWVAGGTGANSTKKYMGGGGGAGGNGSIGTANAGTNTGGAGGPGVTSSADGQVYGAGGGGSGGTVGGSGGTNAGSGSGNGAVAGGGSGSAGFGGGGGGTDGLSAGIGGAGGSGGVVLSYDAYDLYIAAAGVYSSGSFVNGSPTANIPKIFGTSGTITFNAANPGSFGTSTVTVEAGTTISIDGSTFTCGAIYIFGTVTLVNGGVLSASQVVMNSANGGQSIPSGSFAILDCRNTTGINTASGSLTVGTLKNSSGTLAMATNALTVNTTLSNSGTITTTNTGSTPFTFPAGTWGGTIQYESVSAQTVMAGTYTNLTLSGNGSTKTANGPITTAATGTLSVGSGVTLSMGTNALIVNTTLSNSGTISTANTTTTPVTFPATTWGGVIEYASASAQTVIAGTYTNLTLSGNGSTKTANGPIITAATGTLSVGSGVTLSMGTNALTVNTTLANSGTIITTNTTTSPLVLPVSTWGGTIEYANTLGQRVISGTYTNLTCSNSSGTQTLGGNVIVTGTLTIANGGVLDLNGNNLRGVNAFSGTGTIKGSATSRIYITGSAAGTFYMDQTTDLTTNRVKYLGLAASATATLGNKLVVYGDTSYSGVVDLRTSSVLTTNTTATDAARLVFKYNITDDRHGNIGYNGGSISGEALVEDYFPAATIRGYRQLGHTLDSAMSLNQLTDDLDLYGVISSGNGTSGRGNNRDGLIAATSTAKNSIFLYDEKSSTGSKWVPFTTTTTNNVIPFGAGAMYVMRPAGTGEAGSYNAQLIDYEGQVTFGSKSVTCNKLASMNTNGGWNLLSNPYQTCLDFDQFLTTNNTRLNITGFKKYNKETKNYIDHVKSGSAWNRGGASITKPNLHPGDAFWVQVKSDGDIMNFAESMLTNDPTSDVSKGNKLEMDSTLFNTLTMKLSSSQDSTIGDEITLLNASWGKSLNFSAGDMTNVNGTCIDLSVESGNQEKISFKTLPISTDCIIPCFVAACASGTYTFNFDINYNKPVEAMKYRLLDKFTGKQLDIKAGDNYKFSIDLNDSRTFGSGRFYINCIANTLDNENINKGTSEYSIYPNPVSKTEALTIARNASSGKIGTASLLNQLGQVIYRKKITNEMGLEVLDLSSLEIQPGIYFLQLEGNNGTEAIKLVIK